MGACVDVSACMRACCIPIGRGVGDAHARVLLLHPVDERPRRPRDGTLGAARPDALGTPARRHSGAPPPDNTPPLPTAASSALLVLLHLAAAVLLAGPVILQLLILLHIVPLPLHLPHHLLLHPCCPMPLPPLHVRHQVHRRVAVALVPAHLRLHQLHLLQRREARGPQPALGQQPLRLPHPHLDGARREPLPLVGRDMVPRHVPLEPAQEGL